MLDRLAEWKRNISTLLIVFYSLVALFAGFTIVASLTINVKHPLANLLYPMVLLFGLSTDSLRSRLRGARTHIPLWAQIVVYFLCYGLFISALWLAFDLAQRY